MTNAHTYPAFLIEAVPGAKKAVTAIEDAEAAVAKAHAAARAANAAAGELGRWVTPGVRGPALGVMAADFEAGQESSRLASLALVAAQRLVKSKLAALDSAIHAFDLDKRQLLAAKVAVEKHERAVVLWEELATVLDDRDEAHRYAGSPGQDWARGIQYGAQHAIGRVAYYMSTGRVGAYAIDAARRRAAGEDVPREKPRGEQEILSPAKRKQALREAGYMNA